MTFDVSTKLETDFRLPPKPETRLSNITSRLFSILSTPILIRGIDGSHWNDIDFAALKASGIDFVILKATEDVSWVDPKFDEYWKAAHAVGLPIMTYHFFRSNYGGSAQATHHKDTLTDLGFLDTVGYKSPVMWADVETADGASISVIKLVTIRLLIYGKSCSIMYLGEAIIMAGMLIGLLEMKFYLQGGRNLAERCGSTAYIRPIVG
jgi:hypothetical protein